MGERKKKKQKKERKILCKIYNRQEKKMGSIEQEEKPRCIAKCPSILASISQ